MKMLDLFSGIGGFSLAAEWVWGDELEIVGFVENEPYCQKVLQKHWPTVPIHDDVKTYQWVGQDEPEGLKRSKYYRPIDLITGGFPCQDISIAGKGEGVEGNRSGLWFEFHRIIRTVRPRFALIENVPALTFRGLDRVLCDLAEIGYDAEWQIISAAEVGAWHKRQRIWIVAYPNQYRESKCTIYEGAGSEHSGSHQTEEHEQERKSGQMGEEISDTESIDTGRLPERTQKEKPLEGGQANPVTNPGWWATEPDVGRVAHGVPARVDRLKALGNAIVPQVAYVIMNQIKKVMEL